MKKNNFVRIILFDSGKVDFGNYCEASVSSTDKDKFTIKDTDADSIKFDRELSGYYKDIYLINFATLSLNQLQLALK